MSGIVVTVGSRWGARRAPGDLTWPDATAGLAATVVAGVVATLAFAALMLGG